MTGCGGIDAKRLNFIQSQLYYFEIDKLASRVVKIDYASIYVESGFWKGKTFYGQRAYGV
jgi:hypothetical protein